MSKLGVGAYARRPSIKRLLGWGEVGVEGGGFVIWPVSHALAMRRTWWEGGGGVRGIVKGGVDVGR